MHSNRCRRRQARLCSNPDLMLRAIINQSPNQTLNNPAVSSISSAAQGASPPAAKASWESGYPSDCKSAYSGSIPDEASIVQSRISRMPDHRLLHCGRAATVAHKMHRGTVPSTGKALTSHIFAQLLPTLVWCLKPPRCIDVLVLIFRFRGVLCATSLSVW